MTSAISGCERPDLEDRMNTEPRKPKLLIRHWRKRRGMTLKDIAERLNTTPQTIQRIESGKMTASIVWLDKIARALDVPIQALLGSMEEKPGATPEERFTEAMLDELGRSRHHLPADAQLIARLAKQFGDLSDALLDWQIGVGRWEKVERASVSIAALAARISIDGDRTFARPTLQRDPATTDQEGAAA